MSDQIRRLAQECYDTAKATDAPTRAVAQRLIAEAEPTLVAAMAVEFLVEVVSRAQREAALDVERQATRRHLPRKGTKAREVWEQTTDEGRAWAEREEHEERRTFQMTVGVLGKALERYTEEMRIQWTADLLDSTFSLRDGSTVTWGDASVEQHEERRAMFIANAHVNMEGAARHELAIQQLREAGAPTLREMVSELSA